MRSDPSVVNELLEDMYSELNDEIRGNTDIYYNAFVFKQSPSSPVLPHIQLDSSFRPYDENKSKGERKYQLMVNANIYAQDTGKFPRRTIARDLQEKVYDMFYNDYGFDCTFNKGTPNLDANVHKITLRFRALYDVERNIIFRNR